MPKCSSSYTSLGASRHMNSMASWSPSQSEPFTVSYMCQSHESSSMLPSAPPAPTTTASKLRFAGATSGSPEDLHSPKRVTGERQDDRHFERQPNSRRFDVVHQDVAHTHPGVQHHAQRKQGERERHPPFPDQAFPGRIRQRGRGPDPEHDARRLQDHHHCGEALREPVAQPVMRADDRALYHSLIPRNAVS